MGARVLISGIWYYGRGTSVKLALTMFKTGTTLLMNGDSLGSRSRLKAKGPFKGCDQRQASGSASEHEVTACEVSCRRSVTSKAVPCNDSNSASLPSTWARRASLIS
jgi:hypothetical protein